MAWEKNSRPALRPRTTDHCPAGRHRANLANQPGVTRPNQRHPRLRPVPTSNSERRKSRIAERPDSPLDSHQPGRSASSTNRTTERTTAQPNRRPSTDRPIAAAQEQTKRLSTLRRGLVSTRAAIPDDTARAPRVSPDWPLRTNSTAPHASARSCRQPNRLVGPERDPIISPAGGRPPSVQLSESGQ